MRHESCVTIEPGLPSRAEQVWPSCQTCSALWFAAFRQRFSAAELATCCLFYCCLAFRNVKWKFQIINFNKVNLKLVLHSLKCTFFLIIITLIWNIKLTPLTYFFEFLKYKNLSWYNSNYQVCLKKKMIFWWAQNSKIDCSKLPCNIEFSQLFILYSVDVRIAC